MLSTINHNYIAIAISDDMSVIIICTIIICIIEANIKPMNCDICCTGACTVCCVPAGNKKPNIAWDIDCANPPARNDAQAGNPAPAAKTQKELKASPTRIPRVLPRYSLKLKKN